MKLEDKIEELRQFADALCCCDECIEQSGEEVSAKIKQLFGGSTPERDVKESFSDAVRKAKEAEMLRFLSVELRAKVDEARLQSAKNMESALSDKKAIEQLRDLLEADAKLWKGKWNDDQGDDYLDGRASGAAQALSWFYGSFPKYRPEPKGSWGFWRDSLDGSGARYFHQALDRARAEKLREDHEDYNPGEVFFMEE